MYPNSSDPVILVKKELVIVFWHNWATFETVLAKILHLSLIRKNNMCYSVQRYYSVSFRAVWLPMETHCPCGFPEERLGRRQMPQTSPIVLVGRVQPEMPAKHQSRYLAPPTISAGANRLKDLDTVWANRPKVHLCEVPKNIPSKTLRLSAQGLPPRLELLGFGSNGSIFSHCVCVNFHRSLAIKNTPFYGQVYISSCMAQV